MATRTKTKYPGIWSYETKEGRRYRVVVDAGFDEGGKRRQLTRSGIATLAEAKRVRGDLLNEGGKIADGAVLVSAFAERWLRTVQPTVRASTFYGYEAAVRLYVVPALGDHSVREIGAAQVQQFQDDLLVRLSPNTVKRARLVLYLIFKMAERWELVSRNPVGLVDGPRAHESTGDETAKAVWTAAECRHFLESTKDTRHGPLWAFLLATSCRIGEALALTWGAVDLKAGSVSIRQTLTRTKGSVYIIGQPKTQKARRTIALGPVGVAALEALPRGLPGAFVFANRLGRWCHPEDVRQAFIAACTRVGIPRMTVHGLRHSSISIGIGEGVPLVVMSRRAGHANIGITADRYTHLTPAPDEAAADRLGEVLVG